MKRLQHFLPTLPTVLVLIVSGLLLAHGRVAQFANYHDFADHSAVFGIPHTADVLSNLGFALVAAWGLLRLLPHRHSAALASAWPGYALFLCALLLTAAGSSYYHLAPSNPSLVWDRLPIALSCAGLLAGVRADTQPSAQGRLSTVLLGIAAAASVAWWVLTDHCGADDLRPYLLIQALPLLLIPLWQAIYQAPRADRSAFGIAIALYIAAKLAEGLDHQLLAASGVLSGHSLKHLLATAATWVVVKRLIDRVQMPVSFCAPTVPAAWAAEPALPAATQPRCHKK